MLIPDDWFICRSYIDWLDIGWGPHTVDLFSPDENNLCDVFDYLYWRRRTSDINAFGYNWSKQCSFPPLRKKLEEANDAKCQSNNHCPPLDITTWWHLIALDALLLS
jgi:hypothetical protein